MEAGDSDSALKKKKKLNCDFCDETFTREYSLKRHCKVAHSESAMAFECEVCKKVFQRKDVRDKHQKKKKVCVNKMSGSIDKAVTATATTASEVIGNVCGDCGKQFAHRSNLTRHINSVHKVSDLTIVCGKCGKGFSRRDAMLRHEKICNGKVHPIHPLVGGEEEGAGSDSVRSMEEGA
jgi:uncharacterized Zn-finger protein